MDEKEGYEKVVCDSKTPFCLKGNNLLYKTVITPVLLYELELDNEQTSVVYGKGDKNEDDEVDLQSQQETRRCRNR